MPTFKKDVEFVPKVKVTSSPKYLYKDLSLSFNAMINYLVKDIVLDAHGKMLLLYEEKEIVGLAFITLKKATCAVWYLYIKEKKRGYGMGRILFDEILKYAKKRDCTKISFKFQSICPYKKKLVHMFKKAGGKIFSKNWMIYLNINKKIYEKWQRNLEKFEPLKKNLLKKGFNCVSFKKADKKLIEKINNPKTKLDKTYNHRKFINSKRDTFEKDCSFITCKDGDIAALSIIFSLSKEAVVFRLLLSSQKYKNTGVNLLILLSTVEEIFKAGYKKIIMHIDKDNFHMMTQIKEVLNTIKYKIFSQHFCEIRLNSM
ncbi:MAG: GNAT family N-acetyltransferase [Oscillospiraceae bacterium]|nr:GNAT family N-acetyltransferase [Oscillospiraceae bacterium]